MLDKDDWQLLPKFFRRLGLKWGIHHVDRFASDLNHQVPRFYSRFWCPGCEGVDAFSHFWGATKRTLGLAVKNVKEPFACDLRVLRWEDVSFLPTYLEFRFVKRKNDQHRLCGKVRVAKMHGAVVCVYGLLRRYQAVMIRWATPTLPVFPGFSGTVLRHKGELGMVPSSSPIEYPTFRRYLARWLGPLLTPAMTESAFLSRFGTQSSRSGGASAAANADIPFATWGQHGGWKSTSAQLRYMGLDEEHVLSVSRAILSLAEEDELDDAERKDQQVSSRLGQGAENTSAELQGLTALSRKLLASSRSSGAREPMDGDTQSLISRTGSPFGSYMGRSADDNALAAAHAYYQLSHSGSQAALAPYMMAANCEQTLEMGPPAARKPKDGSLAPIQHRASSGKPSSIARSRMSSDSPSAIVASRCPICAKQRPAIIQAGGTRCDTATSLRDNHGALVYDKDGKTITRQCPHVFMPPRTQLVGDELAAPSMSGQKQPLRVPNKNDPNDYDQRLPKVPRVGGTFFRPPQQLFSERVADPGATGSPVDDMDGQMHTRKSAPCEAMPMPLETASAAILRHCISEDVVVLETRIESLAPELRGMLIKGKPRELAEIENDFWQAVNKIEKGLPSLGGGDVFVSMISFVAAAEPQNSELVRFASCTLSDGSPLHLVLLRYCTGKYSKMIYGRPEFDGEIDRRLNATLQHLAKAKEHAMKSKKKTKRGKAFSGKNLESFLHAIELSHCLQNLQAKEFDLETLVMGSCTDDGNPGLMTPEFLAEETGVILHAARKIMECANKIRRKQRSKGTRKQKS
eukprot:jgi/Tetstr1/448418/TSEL_035688.t1